VVTAIGGFSALTVSEKIVPLVADQIINCNKLIKKLDSSSMIEYGHGGDGFQLQVRYADSGIGGATSDYAPTQLRTTQPFMNATDTYRQYKWPLFIAAFPAQRNANADKTAKLTDLVKNSVNEVKQSASTRIGRHAYTGTLGSALPGDAGIPINGLDDIMSQTNTFMGIDRSVAANSWWLAQTGTVANFTADSSSIGQSDGVQAMEALYLLCSQGKQEGDDVPDTVAGDQSNPDYIITSSTVFRGYWTSLSPQQRYSNTTGADTLNSLKFMGVDVVWDNYCAATKMYMINSKTIKMRWCSDSLVDVMMGPMDNVSPLGKMWILGAQGQMLCEAPRFNGVLNVTAL
jgi:hypothetical protein